MPARLASACSISPDLLTVSTIHRRIKPGSNAFYVTAEDGKLYLLKASPSDKASLFARREVFAHAIGIRLGFSMAHWKALHVDVQTLASYHAGADAAESAESNHLTEGVYYGSLIHEGPGSLFEILPRSLAHSNMEVARQLGCIRMFDVWIANAGRREWAVVVDEGYPAHVQFFSHRHILSPENIASASMRAAKAYAEACSAAGSEQIVNSFMRTIASLRSADLHGAFRRVPVFWQDPTGCEEQAAVRLLELRSAWFKSILRHGFNALPACPLPPSRLMCDTVLTKSGGPKLEAN